VNFDWYTKGVEIKRVAHDLFRSPPWVKILEVAAIRVATERDPPPRTAFS
jgi:hypothetical protein